MTDFILLSLSRFIGSPEFFVIAFVFAAAIVAYAALPKSAGPVSEHLVGARLLSDAEARHLYPGVDPTSPAIEVFCDDHGNAILLRHGLAGMNASGAVSAKIAVKGFSIVVYERITPPRFASSATLVTDGSLDFTETQPVTTAMFTLDFLASERYYLRYESESLSMATTIAFKNVPGYHARPSLLRQ